MSFLCYVLLGSKSEDQNMFVTFTDWEGTPDDSYEMAREKFLPMLIDHGAKSSYIVRTGENTSRSFSIWPDEATATAAVDKVRDQAQAEGGGKVTAAASGEVIASA